MPRKVYPFTGRGLIDVDVDENVVIRDPTNWHTIAKYPGGVGPWVFTGPVAIGGSPAVGVDFAVFDASLLIAQMDVESGACTWRLQPPTDTNQTGGDGAIQTWFLQPFGEANTSFCDIKLSYDASGNAVFHFLSDRTGTFKSAQIFTFEIDPRNQSTNAEFEVIRGSFRGGAGTRMLHVTQGVGLDAIEGNTIKLGGGNFVIQTTAGDVVVQPVSTLRPFSDNAFTLGQPAFRWSSIYAAGLVRVDTAGGVDYHYAATAAGTGGAPTLPANTPTGATGGAGKWVQVQLNGATAYLLAWQ